jgi:hypothetical protein
MVRGSAEVNVAGVDREMWSAGGNPFFVTARPANLL